MYKSAEKNSEAKRLISQWVNSTELDLDLEVEAATGHINPDRIHSAGDFVDHLIHDNDELPQSAIDNTQAWDNNFFAILFFLFF